MTTEIRPAHLMFEKDYVFGNLFPPLKALEQDRGKTLERIHVLKMSLSSIVSSRMRLPSAQFIGHPSTTHEALSRVDEMPIELTSAWSGINDKKASQKQSENSGGIASLPHPTTTSCPITTSESLRPFSSNILNTGRKGSHFQNCLLVAHQRIETLMHEKHKLERICVDYEDQINELRQRCMRYSAEIVVPTAGGQLEENGVLTPDAECHESLSSHQTSQIAVPRTLSFSTIEPLLHLLHRLSFHYPEILPNVYRHQALKETLLSPLNDQEGPEGNVKRDRIVCNSPEQTMMLDLNEEEVRETLSHLEKMLPWLLSSSQMTSSLTTAGANLLNWVKALEGEVASHHTKLLDVAKKLEIAKEALKVEIMEKEASVKNAEKLSESLKKALDLMHNEFGKQQLCTEIQKEHIRELKTEIKLLTERQSDASGIKEFAVAYEGAAQEVKRLTARINEIEKDFETDKLTYTYQVEQLQSRLEKNENLLSSAEAECSRLTSVLEVLRQQNQNTEESTQPDSSPEQHLSFEEEPIVAHASPVDQSALLEFQRIMNISSLLNAECLERQSIELLEQGSMNDLCYNLIIKFSRQQRTFQQVELDAESCVFDFCKESLETERGLQDSTMGLISEESGSPTVLQSNIDAKPSCSSTTVGFSYLMTQLKSLEEKFTSMHMLLANLKEASRETEQELGERAFLDMCTPNIDEVDKDNDDVLTLSKELHKFQQRIESLALEVDLLHFKLKQSTTLSSDPAKQSSAEHHDEELQGNLFALRPQSKGVYVVSRTQLPPISVQCLKLDPLVPDKDLNSDGDAEHAIITVSAASLISWDLGEIIAKLTQHPDPSQDHLHEGALESSLYRVGHGLIDALGLAQVGTPSSALWDYFICQLQNLYHAQQCASPFYCSEVQAAKASHLFGALVLQSGVLARPGISFEVKWAAAVSGLCQLIACTSDKNGEIDVQNESLSRWHITKQLIQRVEMKAIHAKRQNESTVTSFVPQHGDIDPTTIVCHLLSDYSQDFQKSFVVSCCAQLEKARREGLQGVDALSMTSLLQLFLMLSQEVDLFNPSITLNGSSGACAQTLIEEDKDQKLISLARCMLRHIDGHVLPFSLLVSQVLSHSSFHCLLRTLLATRSKLLNETFHEKKASSLTCFISDPVVSSEVMEMFVQRILGIKRHDSKVAISPPVVAAMIPEEEILQLYKDNLRYREYLEALLSNIENKTTQG